MDNEIIFNAFEFILKLFFKIRNKINNMKHFYFLQTMFLGN